MIAAIPSPAWGDIGPFAARIVPHPYLYCGGYRCGERLWQGETATGAAIYACRRCRFVCDVRRVP